MLPTLVCGNRFQSNMFTSVRHQNLLPDCVESTPASRSAPRHSSQGLHVSVRGEVCWARTVLPDFGKEPRASRDSRAIAGSACRGWSVGPEQEVSHVF